jgi:hypothetical protein
MRACEFARPEASARGVYSFRRETVRHNLDAGDLTCANVFTREKIVVSLTLVAVTIG